MKLTLDLLKLQNNDSVKNSYYRAPKVAPNIQKMSSDCLIVNTVSDVVEIRRLEEIILSIISDFKFVPYWIIQRWYIDMTGEHDRAMEVVSKLIKVGLVWAETSPTGVYIRPTRFLLDMFHEEFTNYIDIPYNTLTHTIAEQQMMFDVQAGNPNSELWQILEEEQTLLPCYHPLLTDLNTNRPADEKGTIILRESQFRRGQRYKSEEKFIEEEQLIRNQIMAGKSFTEEFSNFSLFPIVSFNQNNNEKKKELYIQSPDNIVPIPRKDGRAQSFAIEIEISAKDNTRYDYIMQSYKDNIKFGKVFYLCGNQRIARLVKDAYREIGGLGSCELYIIPYTPPSMELENFSYKDEIEQNVLFKSSMENTVEGEVNNEQNNQVDIVSPEH